MVDSVSGSQSSSNIPSLDSMLSGSGGSDAQAAAKDIFDESVSNSLKNGRMANQAKDIAGIIQAAGRT